MIQAYNYLVGSFPVKKEVMYPANKRSELKKVYSDIVNLSKRSPYYKINLSRDNQEYTIGVKEAALELKAKIKNIMDLNDSGFHSRTVLISDESVLSAKLLNQNTDNLPDMLKIKVNSIASPQVNRGSELLLSSNAFPQGKYDFSVTVKGNTYLLSYQQKERTTNRETMNQIVDFLNESVPGITTIVEKGEERNYGCIAIASDTPGRTGDKNFFFEDAEDYKVGLADFFGLNRMDQTPSNAQFELNDTNRQTASNTFTLENTLHISLHQTSDQPVTLRIIPDSDKILPEVDSVLASYNSIIGLANDRKLDNEEHYSAAKLIREMKSLDNRYEEELSACGIRTMEDGTLQIEDSLAVQAARDGGMESLFQRENGFIARLMDKAEAIAINPLEYIEKTIVTYPNHEKNLFCNPYITSMYSGLFFSSYC